jgi:hypothetical protein
MNQMMSTLKTGGQHLFQRMSATATFAMPLTRTALFVLAGFAIVSQSAHAGSITPEIDPGSAGAALTVLAGAALVLRAHLRSKRRP